MHTVVQTPTFQRQVANIWVEDELDEFIDWLAINPTAGDVVPGTQGARKIRWAAKGQGKRAGARVIYFNRLDAGFILMLAVYAKNAQENMSAKAIQGIKND